MKWNIKNEQQDSHIECTVTINKQTKIQNYTDTGHKRLEQHHCKIVTAKNIFETNLSNAILNSNNIRKTPSLVEGP